MSHIWASHVTYMDESHVWTSHDTHVKHIDESCRTYGRVMLHMSHISTSHVTHMNKSCHTYE